jgi:hypothetical protein
MSIQLIWPTLMSVAFKLVTVHGMASKCPETPKFCAEMTQFAVLAAFVSKLRPLITPWRLNLNQITPCAH